MPDELDKIIQERFKSLPKEIKQAILSPHFEGNIDYVRNKNGLLIDKQIPLKNEVFMLMLGFADTQEFPKNISDALNIPAQEAELIAREIYKRMIEPIESTLAAFNFAIQNEEAARKTATPTKIEGVEQKGPNITITTSSRVPLEEGLGGMQKPAGITAPKDELMPSLAKKTFGGATPQKIASWPPSPNSAPLPPSKPVSPSAMVMPKSADEISKLTPPTAPTPAQKTTVPPPNLPVGGAPSAKIPEVTSALAAEIGNLLKKPGGAQPPKPEEKPPQPAVPAIKTPVTVSSAQYKPEPPKPQAVPPPKTLIPFSLSQPAPSQVSSIKPLPPLAASPAPTAPKITPLPGGMNIVTPPKEPVRPPISPMPMPTPPVKIAEPIIEKVVSAPVATPPPTPPKTPATLPSYAQPIKTPPPSASQALGMSPTPLRPEDKLAGLTTNPRVEVEMSKQKPSDGGGDPYREPLI